MKKLLDRIMTHNDSNPALFVTERKPHERLGRCGIQRIFSELGKRARLSKRVYPHLLRHTTTTVNYPTAKAVGLKPHVDQAKV